MPPPKRQGFTARLKNEETRVECLFADAPPAAAEAELARPEYVTVVGGNSLGETQADAGPAAADAVGRDAEDAGFVGARDVTGAVSADAVLPAPARRTAPTPVKGVDGDLRQKSIRVSDPPGPTASPWPSPLASRPLAPRAPRPGLLASVRQRSAIGALRAASERPKLTSPPR